MRIQAVWAAALCVAAIFALGACEQQAPGSAPESNNVTRTFTVRSSQFQITDIGSAGVSVGYAAAEYSFPEITSEVVSKGLVHAYVQTATVGDDDWVTLPFSMTVGSGPAVTLDITYAYKEGNVGLVVYSNVSARALAAGLPTLLDGWKFRVVVDPS